ncbi:MAG TPA: hypothetical protein VEL76_10155, partial [Gemmataceae bacterium]|nr:hypothetical protein [Gemmataceae bacterium]
MATTSQDIGRYLEQQLRAKGRNAVMTYGELLEVFNDLPEFTQSWASHPLCKMFGDLDIEDAFHNRPFRTAIVVSKDNGVPGGGFFKMYVEHRDPEAQIRSDLDRI